MCPDKTCNSSYIGESSRCLENMIKEHNTLTTSAIYQHSSTHNHPKADISHFKIIDQDSKQVSKETRDLSYTQLQYRQNVHSQHLQSILKSSSKSYLCSNCFIKPWQFSLCGYFLILRGVCLSNSDHSTVLYSETNSVRDLSMLFLERSLSWISPMKLGTSISLVLQYEIDLLLMIVSPVLSLKMRWCSEKSWLCVVFVITWLLFCDDEVKCILETVCWKSYLVFQAKTLQGILECNGIPVRFII